MDFKNKTKSLLFKRNLSLLIKILVGGILLWFIFDSVDLEKLRKTILMTDPWYLTPGIIAFALAVVVSAAAWKILLIPLGLEISWVRAIKIRLIAFFFNMILPSGIAGDVWRGFVYGAEVKNPGGSFASVLAEKWVSFVSLTISAVFALFLGIGDLKQEGLFYPVLHFILLMVSATLISIILFPWFTKKGTGFFSRFGISSPYFIGVKSLGVYGKKTNYVWYALVVTMLSPLLGSVAFYFSAAALGYKLPFYVFIVLVPLVRVINHIPVSINAIGTQDVAMVLFLTRYGISREVSFSTSLLAHGLKLVVTLMGAVSYLISPTLQYPRTSSGVEEQQVDQEIKEGKSAD